MKRQILIGLGCVILTACAVSKPKQGMSTWSNTKMMSSKPAELFSRWKQDNTTFIMDFTNGSCSTPFPFDYLPPGGSVCKCQLDCAGGTSLDGKATMSLCTYQKGTAKPDEDPGCPTLNADYRYTNANGMLSFTNIATGVTTTYHVFQKDPPQQTGK